MICKVSEKMSPRFLAKTSPAIKICGLKTLQEVEVAVEAGVEAVGFVLAKSSRQISLETARVLAHAVPPWIVRYGVFVDEDPAVIQAFFEAGVIDIAQLHGGESIQDCQRFEGKVVKAFRLHSKEQLETVWEYAKVCRGVLLDAYSSKAMGGTGELICGELLKGEELPPSWILAGGLRTDNVREKIREWGPSMVDVSSGVEGKDGKDFSLIQQFVREVRAAYEDGAR